MFETPSYIIVSLTTHSTKDLASRQIRICALAVGYKCCLESGFPEARILCCGQEMAAFFPSYISLVVFALFFSALCILSFLLIIYSHRLNLLMADKLKLASELL